MVMLWIHHLVCGDVVEHGDMVDTQSSIWRCGGSKIWHVEMWWNMELWLIHSPAYGDVIDLKSGMLRCDGTWRCA